MSDAPSRALPVEPELELRAELGRLKRERDEARDWCAWLRRQATAPGLTDAERLSIIANFPASDAAADVVTPKAAFATKDPMRWSLEGRGWARLSGAEEAE